MVIAHRFAFLERLNGALFPIRDDKNIIHLFNPYLRNILQSYKDLYFTLLYFTITNC